MQFYQKIRNKMRPMIAIMQTGVVLCKYDTFYRIVNVGNCNIVCLEFTLSFEL